MPDSEQAIHIEPIFNIYAVDYGYFVKDGEWWAGIETHCIETDAAGEIMFLPESERTRRVIVENGVSYVGMALEIDQEHAIPVDEYLEKTDFAMEQAGQERMPPRFREAVGRMMRMSRSGPDKEKARHFHAPGSLKKWCRRPPR